MSRRTADGYLGNHPPTARNRGVYALSTQAARHAVGSWTDSTEAVAAASTAAWVRPVDWLAMPTVANTENKIVGLVEVPDDTSNYLAVSATASAPTVLTNIQNTTDLSSYTTASVSMVSPFLYILAVSNTHATSATLPTISASASGLTITQRATTTYNGGLNRLTIFSIVASSPFTGTLTIDFAGVTQTGCVCVLDRFSGVNTTTNDGIVQSNISTGTGTSAGTTLSAAPTNMVIGFNGFATNGAITPGAGFTEVGNDVGTTAPSHSIEHIYGANGTTAATVSSSVAWAAIAFEISVPATFSYTVDWGDGTSASYASAAVAEKQYSFSSISSGTTTSIGTRQVLVSITSTWGLSTFNLSATHSAGLPSGYAYRWKDLVISTPYLLSIPTIGAILAERVRMISSALATTASLFRNLYAMRVCDFATSNRVTTMQAMFAGCGALEEVPLFDTTYVTTASANPAGAFENCVSLKEIPAYNFASLTSMGQSSFYGLFSGCSSLLKVNASFTGPLTDISSAFQGCSSLVEAPLLNTALVTAAYQTFYRCYSLTSVPAYNMPLCTTTKYMFYLCYSLETAPAFKFSALTNVEKMFESCISLSEVALFNTATVTVFTNMFASCSSLTRVPKFNTSSGTLLNGMFNGCTGLLAVPLFDTSAATNMSGMFASCYKLTTVPLFSTATVTIMSNMFFNCYSLTAVPAFNTSALVSMDGMFNGCSALREVPLFNTANVTNMGATFASSGIMYPPAWNTVKVTTFSSMFSGCTELKELPLYNMAAAQSLSSMLKDTLSLRGIPAWSAPNVVSISDFIALSTGGASTRALEYCYATFGVLSSDVNSAANFSGYGLRYIAPLNMTSVGAARSPAGAAPALTSYILNGMRYTTSCANFALDRDALEAFMTALGIAAGAQTVTISGNRGAPTPVSLSGTTTSGSTTVTMASTTGLAAGMEISGVGISDAVAVTFQDSGDTVTRNAHGLANDTRISFASITSTTGIAAYTYYYVINATTNTFQVASSVGGSALPLTTNGSGTMLYGTTITAITPNTSITLSAPASASGTITTSSAVLKRSLARLKGWTVSG